MKKLLPILSMCILLLCGCTTDYGRKDIKEFVKTEYGLKKISVKRKAEEVKHGEEHSDYLWTVEDRESGVTFHVLDDYEVGKMGLYNSLWSDYEDARLVEAFKEYHPEHISLESSTEDSMYSAKIIGTYSSRKELQELFEETNAFVTDYLDNEVKVSVYFTMENPYRNNVDGYEVNDADYHKTAKEFGVDLYEDADNRLLLVSVDYGFDDYLADFTEEKIREVVKENKFRLGVADSAEGPYEYYDDLCGSQYYYGVSFSTLYQILEREGYPVEGDKNHYSFVGVDGSTYEISYDFVGYEYDEGKVGYYYLKDGVETPMDFCFYNHFEAPFIRDTTGIYVREQWEEEGE